MKAFRQFGVLVLLLVSCLAPAMACLLPGSQMNAQERACCRKMTSQCGAANMPAAHGCCQKTPPRVYDRVPDTKVVTLHPIATAAIWLAVSHFFDHVSVIAGLVEDTGFTPPKAPPSSVSVLRI